MHHNRGKVRYNVDPMVSFLKHVLDPHARTLARYQQIVAHINSFSDAFEQLDNAELQAKTANFRTRLSQGETLEQLLPEAFAAVREAGRRALQLRHFDVQLMAGIAFHEGKVAEQRTGEGKTLSATLALYLNALPGKGVHLVTVNDYLAQIGAGWMGPLYHALGMRVGVIIHDQAFLYDPNFRGEERGDERLEHFRPISRQEAYAADITYGTNNEFGFDYLRDNMAQRLSDQVQRGHVFAIVDEADSILIDEARTPLIISAPDAEPTEKYVRFSQLVKLLTPGADFVVDEKLRTAVLTDLGVKRLERQLNVHNLYEESFDTLHHIEQALKAHKVFQRDKDYVVREGEVVIVDEHTGRLMFGRRYSDGLHQAIEAKEGVKVQQESRTLATISLQNYFRQYDKLAGMSGTGTTEAEEFKKIYDMDVLAMPTHRPIQRIDHPDVIFKNVRVKYSAIVREIQELHASGRPILVGTRSIEQNQIVADLLTRQKIPHQVLNAKNHEREAFIIAEAGKPGAITVATNIAGRGVDIVLGGAKPERRNYASNKEFQAAQEDWQKSHDAVVQAGGLHVLGTERHESRRIDNQLRGRAGRQGDPGSSRFYVSLDDEIMRLFGGDQIKNLMDMLHFDETQPIEHPLITKAISQAQIKVEGFYFDQRKSLVEYDDVMNRQREVIYKRRQRLLELAAHPDNIENAELKDRILHTASKHWHDYLAARADESFTADEERAVLTELATIVPFDDHSLRHIGVELGKKNTLSDKEDFLIGVVRNTYTAREQQLKPALMREIELFTYLSIIDEHWMNHLDDMTNLRDSVWLRGSKEQALAEYKREAFELFARLVDRVELEALKRVFRVEVQPVQPSALRQAITNETEMKNEPTAGESTTPSGKTKKGKVKKARKKGSYLRK